MFLNIAICDDDPKVIEQLKSYVEDYEIAFDHDFRVDVFQDGTTLLDSDHLSEYNILFLDIEMPILTGIDAARIIRNAIAPVAKIIFISNYPEYMQSSFSVHPYHYLRKPISGEIISSVLTSAIQDIEKATVFVPITLPDLSIKTININNIIYIESGDSRKRLVIIHSIDSVFEAKGILTEYETRFHGKQFLRCHKSILVNLFHIHYIHQQKIILDTGDTIPIGRAYITEIRNILSKTIFQIK